MTDLTAVALSSAAVALLVLAAIVACEWLRWRADQRRLTERVSR